MKTGGDDLAGCRVLIVEDDSVVVMLLRALLTELGCEVVGVASRIADAAQKCETMDFDLALLDINLRGEYSFAIAEALHSRGKPVVMTSGYTASILPPALEGVPLLQKPYRRQDLEAALRKARHAQR